MLIQYRNLTGAVVKITLFNKNKIWRFIFDFKEKLNLKDIGNGLKSFFSEFYSRKNYYNDYITLLNP